MWRRKDQPRGFLPRTVSRHQTRQVVRVWNRQTRGTTIVANLTILMAYYYLEKQHETSSNGRCCNGYVSNDMAINDSSCGDDDTFTSLNKQTMDAVTPFSFARTTGFVSGGVSQRCWSARLPVPGELTMSTASCCGQTNERLNKLLELQARFESKLPKLPCGAEERRCSTVSFFMTTTTTTTCHQGIWDVSPTDGCV